MEGSTQLLVNGAVGGEVGEQEHFSFNVVDVTLNRSCNNVIPKTWVLLDNQSTVDLCCNLDLLSNIRKVNSRVKVHYDADKS